MAKNHLTDIERTTVPPPVAHQYRGSGWGFGMQVVVNSAEQDKNIAYASEGSFGFAGALGTWFLVDPKEQMIQIFMHQMLSPTDLGRRRFQNLTYEAIA
jgi:CubicO group peptidase (beta-lactamase class C family)